MKYGLFWSALCLSFGIFLYSSLPLYEESQLLPSFVLPALAAIKITHKKEAVLILCGAFLFPFAEWAACILLTKYGRRSPPGRFMPKGRIRLS